MIKISPCEIERNGNRKKKHLTNIVAPRKGYDLSVANIEAERFFENGKGTENTEDLKDQKKSLLNVIAFRRYHMASHPKIKAYHTDAEEKDEVE